MKTKQKTLEIHQLNLKKGRGSKMVLDGDSTSIAVVWNNITGQNFDNEQWNRIWQSSAADSIEHIRPQSWWTSIDWEPDPNEVHRLGNLLILPPRLNSKLSTWATRMAELPSRGD